MRHPRSLAILTDSAYLLLRLAMARELDRSHQDFIVRETNTESPVMNLRKSGKVD